MKEKTRKSIISSCRMGKQDSVKEHSNVLIVKLIHIFRPTDAVNLLSLVNSTGSSIEELSARINQVVDKNDFTIMLTIRSKVCCILVLIILN